MELAQWRKHIEQVVEDEGQWLGVLDEDGYPLYELGGLVRHSFPTFHLGESSVEVELSVTPGDRVLDDLVGEGLGVVDESGVLVPASGPARLLCLVRGGKRVVALVTHSVVAGREVPSTLTVHGVGLNTMLLFWPCPSVPVEWASAGFSEWETDASGLTYSQARVLAQVQFATRADGYTKIGPGVTMISELVQDSFDAVNTLYGWVDDPHAVVEFAAGVDGSPEVAIRVNDDPVGDTISEPARVAGLGVFVDLWWPGDDPVRVRSADRGSFGEVEFSHPVQVVRVKEVG